MSKTSGSMNQTVVKIVFGILMGLIPCTSSAGQITPAQEEKCKADAEKLGGSAKDKMKAELKCIGAYVDGRVNFDDDKGVNCNDVDKQAAEIRRNITKACNDAGLGKSCAANSMACGKELEEEDFDTASAIGAALGIPNANNQQVANKCPQMSTRDASESRKSLQKDIKEDEKELADLAKEAAELQADYDKEVQKIQEDLTKAQEDYKEKEKKFNQDERERIADFQKTQAQAAQDLRSKGDEILSLRGQLTALLRNKARALNKLSESTGKLACMAEVNKMKAEYEKMMGSSTSSSANFIGQAKKKKLEMTRTYSTCMADFYQQRIQLNEQTQNQQETLEKKIADTQSTMDNIQDSLNLAQNQLNEIAKDAAESKKEALQSVIDLGTRSQQQMQSAYSKLQKNLQALQAKTASTQKSLTTANNELLSLGPVPKTKKDLSASDAAQTIADEVQNLNSIAKNPAYKDCGSIKNIQEEVKKYKDIHGIQ
ncbi:MAG: hypothetical protein HUU57_00445 [Bdellovibrio sp.]|nr:hypothetical protein [Bdellovibrio sp.]